MRAVRNFNCHDCGCVFSAWNDLHLRCKPCRDRTRRLQSNALSKVKYAVKTGRLPNLRLVSTPCVDCGQTARNYDHRDYRKPLDVVPVCETCNRKRGPAAPLGAAA